jgi:hypothetical protein
MKQMQHTQKSSLPLNKKNDKCCFLLKIKAKEKRTA